MKCNKCHQEFSTRNKLFQHIKETGHALHESNQDGLEEPIREKGGRKNRKKRS